MPDTNCPKDSFSLVYIIVAENLCHIWGYVHMTFALRGRGLPTISLKEERLHGLCTDKEGKGSKIPKLVSRRHLYMLPLTPDRQSPQVESRTRTCHKVCLSKDTVYWSAKRVTLFGQRSVRFLSAHYISVHRQTT